MICNRFYYISEVKLIPLDVPYCPKLGAAYLAVFLLYKKIVVLCKKRIFFLYKKKILCLSVAILAQGRENICSSVSF